MSGITGFRNDGKLLNISKKTDLSKVGNRGAKIAVFMAGITDSEKSSNLPINLLKARYI